MDAVLAGRRLDLPKQMPRQLGKIVKSCWERKPKDRPDFREIMEDLDDLAQLLSFKLSPQQQEFQQAINNEPVNINSIQNSYKNKTGFVASTNNNNRVDDLDATYVPKQK